MAASGGSKVTYGAMKCALSKARGGRVQFHFSFGVEKSNLKSILNKLIHRFTVDSDKLKSDSFQGRLQKTVFAQSRTMHKIRNEIEFEKAKSKMEILQSYLFL